METLPQKTEREYEVDSFVPLDKSWMMRMGMLDLLHGYDDTIDFLESSQALVAGDTVELPAMQLSRYHEVAVSRSNDAETGRTIFSLHRTDIGNEQGGFYVQRSHAGDVIITRDIDNPQPEDCTFAQLLMQAERTVEVYADTLSITEAMLRAHENTDHLLPVKITELEERIKREQTIRFRAKRRAQTLGNQALRQVSKLVTEPDEDSIIPGRRKLSKVRIAALALTLPLPGYSGTFGDSFVPRPASIAFAGDVTGFVGDMLPEKPEPKPDPVVLYDDERINLPPAEGSIVMNEQGQDVPILTSAPAIPDGVPEIRSYGTSLLEGQSPRRVIIDEPLPSRSCVRIGIAPSAQNKSIVFASTDARQAGRVELDVSPEAIYVCNKSDTLIPSGQQFYFDTE